MPPSGVITRTEAVAAFRPYRVTDGNIFPDNAMTEALVVGVDLGSMALTLSMFTSMCTPGTTPLTSPLSWRTVKIRLWSVILQNKSGQSGSSWRGEPINSSQIANLDQPIRLPPQGHPSSNDITLLSSYILPGMMWPTLPTLGSDHLPITISLSIHAAPSLRKFRSCTNFRKADWEGFTTKSEMKFAETPLPTFWSAGEEVFQRIFSDA